MRVSPVIQCHWCGRACKSLDGLCKFSDLPPINGEPYGLLKILIHFK
jgi:hypothetical protein